MKNINKLTPVLFPGRCPVCDSVVAPGKLICRGCVGKLELIKEPTCMKCGKQLWQETQYCYDCGRKHFTYERGFALYNYDETTRRSIVAFKYKGRAEYANYYGLQMARQYYQTMKMYDINAVLAVPIHSKRLGIRGYNQAELICNRLCEITGMINLSGLILRTKNTRPQKELDDVGRRKNLEKAFEINDNFTIPNGVKNVIIIDDIYTTGITIDTCSKIVKDMIGCKVYFSVLAIGRGL